MAPDKTPIRHARGVFWHALAAVVLALVATVLLLVRGNPAVAHRPASYAQLENKQGLFAPPPPRPDSGETYVYTPLSAQSAEQPRIGSPISPDAHPTPPPDAHPTPPPRFDDPPPQIALATPDAPRPQTIVWVQRPTARRISELFPPRALRAGVGGRVQLECLVLAELTVECEVLSEQPPNQGFGRAALSASKDYRVSPTLTDGASAVGARTRIAINFVSPQ
jgi:protein TonB